MKFKVGDVCITQGSRFPLLNDNQLVVIVEVCPEHVLRSGESTPYTICRIDGQVHPSTSNDETGVVTWYGYKRAICAEHRLRKPDVGDLPADIVRTVVEPLCEEVSANAAIGVTQ